MFERAYGWVPKQFCYSDYINGIDRINSITLSKVISCETYERQEPIRKSKTARQVQEMEWEGGGGWREIKAGRLGRRGKGSLSLFPLTLFPATSPPSSPFPFFSCHTTTKLCFSIKTIASKGVGDQGSRGERGKWLPIPCRFRVFLPPPFPFFTCHATTKLCFSIKTIASKGVGDQGSRGERGKWLPIPCRFRVFLPPPSLFSPVTQLR